MRATRVQRPAAAATTDIARFPTDQTRCGRRPRTLAPFAPHSLAPHSSAAHSLAPHSLAGHPLAGHPLAGLETDRGGCGTGPAAVKVAVMLPGIVDGPERVAYGSLNRNDDSAVTPYPQGGPHVTT